MSEFHQKLNELLSAQQPFVTVTVVDTTGSVPNETGSKMLVSSGGLEYGTVGGGKVEKKALDQAASMLQSDDPSMRTKFLSWSLEKDVGMTCGGTVRLYFEKQNTSSWQICIFGAGHVASALICLLQKLECRISCIDPRQEWLNKLPQAASLRKINLPESLEYVSEIPENAFVILMTMGHATDLPILAEILKTRKFPYLGVIGSEAKAARLRRDLKEAGISEELCRSFFCPIGLPIGNNHPQEIAVSICAQLLQERDRLQKT